MQHILTNPCSFAPFFVIKFSKRFYAIFVFLLQHMYMFILLNVFFTWFQQFWHFFMKYFVNDVFDFQHWTCKIGNMQQNLSLSCFLGESTVKAKKFFWEKAQSKQRNFFGKKHSQSRGIFFDWFVSLKQKRVGKPS